MTWWLFDNFIYLNSKLTEIYFTVDMGVIVKKAGR